MKNHFICGVEHAPYVICHIHLTSFFDSWRDCLSPFPAFQLQEAAMIFQPQSDVFKIENRNLSQHPEDSNIFSSIHNIIVEVERRRTTLHTFIQPKCHSTTMNSP